ncbi:heavy metal-associated isoprenylated plant protein 7-like isoform X2 [Fagus crenata]
MGEENKEEEKKDESKEEKKEEEKKEEKKEEEPPEIVLKVDMHCEACARKMARALKGFEGVEEVTTDSKTSKVVVNGKAADPIKVCERLQKKSGRKVEIISPLPKPPEENKEENKEPKEEKKEEPPAVITVKLQVAMHCEACAQGIQRRIRRIKEFKKKKKKKGQARDLYVVFFSESELYIVERLGQKHITLINSNKPNNSSNNKLN